MAKHDKNIPIWKKWWAWVIALVASVGLAAAYGIIGNRSDGFFVGGWDSLGTPQDIRIWLIGFAVILIGIGLFIGYLILKHREQIRALEQQRDTALSQPKKNKREIASYHRQIATLRTDLQAYKERHLRTAEDLRGAFISGRKQETLLLEARIKIEALSSENAQLMAETEKLSTDNALQREALKRMSSLAAMDLTLLDLITTVVSCRDEDRETQMTSLLSKLLKDTTPLFDDICRLWILRPDGKREYLECWVSQNMSEKHAKEHRFYIGDDASKKSGVAGYSYQTLNLEVVHLIEKNGRWTADHPEYIFTDGNMEYPGFRSFVSIPVRAPHNECLGVLCLDSEKATTFDVEGISTFLYSLGSRLAAAITIYNSLISADL